MRIVVCVKQVPDTTDVKLDPKTNTLIRTGLPSIINPDDRAAIEEALKIKDQQGAEVIVLTMGPPQAESALREALAMGADRAILLTSRFFGGADTWATSLTIAKAIEQKLGEIDLIFCGRQAIDGDTAQVGPEIAEHLDIPQVTYVKKICSIAEDILVERALEDGFELISASKPAVLTFVKEANTPRFPTMGGIIDAFEDHEVEVWTEADIDVEREQLGLKGSPTKVKKSFPPPKKDPGQMIDGTTAKEKAKKLAACVLAANLL